MNGRDLAMHHASLGRRVFPFRIERAPDGKRKKVPLVKWKTEASSDAADIRRMWTSVTLRPGWTLPEGYVVVDVDDPTTFGMTGLSLPLTASQTTLRGGGSHHLYAITSDVAQVADRHRGFDTRVGGRGWVGLYSPDSFVGRVADAPAWVYGLAGERSGPVTEEPISSRTEILSAAGRMRWAGLSGDDIETVLLGWLERGRIYAAVETDPWMPEDLARIAADYGTKPVGVHAYEGPAITFTRTRRRRPGMQRDQFGRLYGSER